MLGAPGNQRTIGVSGRIEGVGLHSGERAEVILRPAPVDHGIKFFRNDYPADFMAEAQGEPSTDAASLRTSVLGTGENQIMTVEHLVAALAGLEITNVAVEVHGSEVPALDGSAGEFVKIIKALGIVDQALPKDCRPVTEPIFLYEKNSALCITPAAVSSVAYVLDYPGVLRIGTELVDFDLSPDVFESEIAPARTYCTEEEADRVRAMGFGRGATRENTLVVSSGQSRTKLRFEDECARHKVLDILGDLALIGFSLVGRVVGIRSGHALNRRLAQQIRR